MLKKLAATGIISVAATGMLLAGTPANADAHTSGQGGVLSGNQVFVPIAVPVNVCGNAVAVIGIAGAGCRGGSSVSVHPHHPGHPHHPHHPGRPCHHHHYGS